MPSGPSLYNRRSHFDEELYRRVEESYELVAWEEDQYVFLPRRRRASRAHRAELLPASPRGNAYNRPRTQPPSTAMETPLM